MDKKYHKALLVLLDTTATITTLSNKLAQLAIDADDPQLQQIADILAKRVRPQPHDNGSKKVCLSAMLPMLKAANNPVSDGYAKAIEFALKYGKAVVASIHPEWMFSAQAAGWRAPDNALPIAYLREVDAGTVNACFVVSAEGDPGAFAVKRA